jgi:PhnB protein
MSEYERAGMHTVRPYLIVDDVAAAIDFYTRAFDAIELERHGTPTGGVGHAKLRIGDAIIEMGEHPSGGGRKAAALPAIGLRLYVADVDETFRRAIAAGATGEPPTDRPEQASRAATVYDPSGMTWWLATPFETAGS